MRTIAINWIAVFGAAVVKFVLGFIWYSDYTFGKQWMKLTGTSAKQMKADMPKALAVDFIGALIMAFVLFHAVRYAGAATWQLGALVGFGAWLGFLLPPMAATTVYERRDMQLLYITGGFWLVALVLMGVILAVWR